VASVVVVGEESAALSESVGILVHSVADCGGDGKVLGCGYVLIATDAQFANAIVDQVGPDNDASQCFAFLRRTATAGSTAGAKVQVSALCAP
jgi:hypothetical protein